MGFSVYYSLALSPEGANPIEVDVDSVEVKFRALAEIAKQLAIGTNVRISPVRVLNASGLAHAQADMTRDFAFARSVCCPPGRNRQSVLGEVPKLSLYFSLSSRSDDGLYVGIAQYQPDAVFQMIAEDGDQSPYDGRWYYWTFFDTFTREEVSLLKAVLVEAKRMGFQTTFRDEAE